MKPLKESESEKEYKRVHDKVKTWLIDLGEKNYDRAWSGDDQLLDVRIKKGHTEYRPDVIWEYDGKKVIFEIAFAEDWRAILGESLLCALSGNCVRMYIIKRMWEDEDEEFYKNLELLVNGLFKKENIRDGLKIIPIPTELISKNKMEDIKKEIMSGIRDWLE